MLELRTNCEASAILVIKQSSKYTWRIETRVAKKINRSIHPDKRNRLHVADHAIILNWRKGHLMAAPHDVIDDISFTHSMMHESELLDRRYVGYSSINQISDLPHRVPAVATAGLFLRHHARLG